MDKEWLERRLYKRVGTIYGVQEKTEDVDAIAAQHEEEVARVRSEKTELLPCGHPASVVEDDGCQMCALERVNRWLMEQLSKSLAQVAEMGRALEEMRREIQEYRWKPEAYDIDGTMILLEQTADNALSAAPKVWRMQGRTSKYYDLEVMAEGAPEEFRQLLISRSMFAPWDVIVFLPPGEQPTESEQEATDGTH